MAKSIHYTVKVPIYLFINEQFRVCLMSVHTNLNSPLLLATRSGAQYLAEVSSTTMWTVLVVLPLLVLTRHSHFPVKPG